MIVVVDYGVGNLASIKNMFKRIDQRDVVISSDKDVVAKAAKLILPGVGAFDAGMEKLNSSGLVEVLNQKVLVDKTPILGVCLGMQLMTKSSEEGILPGLGWVDAEVKKFTFSEEKNLKVPHMGWNFIRTTKDNALLTDEHQPKFYFVHSYYVWCNNTEDVLAESLYGIPFHSALNRDNIYGMQFHPEKSLKYGMEVFNQFSSL